MTQGGVHLLSAAVNGSTRNERPYSESKGMCCRFPWELDFLFLFFLHGMPSRWRLFFSPKHVDLFSNLIFESMSPFSSNLSCSQGEVVTLKKRPRLLNITDFAFGITISSVSSFHSKIFGKVFPVSTSYTRRICILTLFTP